MARSGLDQLTNAQKRALLAEHLRRQSLIALWSRALPDRRGITGAAPNDGHRSFLDNEVIALASVRNWSARSSIRM